MKTAKSSRTSAIRGALAGAIATSPSTAHQPRTRPATPPSTASSRLSVSSCRTRRPLPAPSATRTASSRPRPEALAITRFAMFAQAINRTNATAPSIASRPGLMSPTTRSRRSMRLIPVFSLKSGCCASRRRASTVAAAWARSIDSPAGRRATARSTTAPRDGVTVFRRSGRHRSALADTIGRNPAGSTPMIS